MDKNELIWVISVTVILVSMMTLFASFAYMKHRLEVTCITSGSSLVAGDCIKGTK